MADYTDVKQADGTVRRTFKKGAYGKGTGRAQRVIVVGKPVDPYLAPAAAATATKYQPAEESLAGQQRAQAFRGNQVAAWYDNYRKAVSDATAGNIAQAEQSQTALKSLGTAVSDSDRAGQGQINAQMQADAASRGASVDPNVGARMIEGSAVRGGNLAQSAALQRFVSVQQGAIDRQKGVAGEGLKVAALEGNAAQSRAIDKQRTDLLKEKGAFQVETRDSLEAAARKQALEDYITQETLGIKKQSADTAAAAPARKAAAEGAKVNSYGYSNADWAKLTPAKRQAVMKKVKAEGRAPKTPKATESPYGTPDKQLSKVKRLGEAKSVAAELKTKGGDRSRARDALLKGINTGNTSVSKVQVPDDPNTPENEEVRVNVSLPGKKRDPIDELTARIALDQTFNPDGALSDETVALLHAAGIQVKTIGGKTRAQVTSSKPKRIVRPNPDQRG